MYKDVLKGFMVRVLSGGGWELMKLGLFFSETPPGCPLGTFSKTFAETPSDIYSSRIFVMESLMTVFQEFFCPEEFCQKFIKGFLQQLKKKSWCSFSVSSNNF